MGSTMKASIRRECAEIVRVPNVKSSTPSLPDDPARWTRLTLPSITLPAGKTTASRTVTGLATKARNVSSTLATRELNSASSFKRIRVPAGNRYIESGWPKIELEFAKINNSKPVTVASHP
jgi:hypothetical protein